MYFINLSKHNLVVMTSLVMLVLSGCSSTTKPSEVAATNQKGTRISAEELAQLKASSQQWQSAKEGVERLLIIEEDLKLLISQLNAVVKQEGDSNEAVRSVTISPLKKVEEKPQTAITKPAIKIEKTSQMLSSPVIAKAEKPVLKPEVDETNKVKRITPASSEKAEYIPATARYALQVAAVTDKTRLKQSLNEIKNNSPELFQGPFIANIESVDIGGVTFYRLKLGAYETQANAKAGCDKLKKREINCVVSHYTQAPLNN
ncbi:MULTISPECIES: SPOR domain-containing protein [unclassified Pseudoalteromonas]|jgi:hypothetical protein|uniref:SPOR domain-containing protein n=1 Tax=unclassified Pseudoalteromonas TaxID=194690 RepID=UPI000463C7CA|nr:MULTISPECIES: SPOR domain-containing protein [unclassified Pseudoalteromonas]MBH0087860.1 SPOR domain-containing protein [Pseudoalteromonas sp. NSLLW218]